jgi:hypothetical protein
MRLPASSAASAGLSVLDLLIVGFIAVDTDTLLAVIGLEGAGGGIVVAGVTTLVSPD